MATRPKVFLTYATGMDSSRARTLLAHAGFDVRSWDDELQRASNPLAPLPAALRTTQALVILVGPERVADAALFEAGAFHAVDKSVVLLLERRATRLVLPPLLRNFPIVALGDDLDTTAARLSQTITFGKQPKRPRSAANSGSATRPLGTSLESSLRGDVAVHPEPSLKRDWADQTERQVADVLTQLGGEVIPRGPGNTKSSVDMAFWVPNAPIEWNPVLVDAAGRNADINGRVHQLSAYLLDQGALLGMLVLPHAHDVDWRVFDSNAVLVVGLPQLAALSVHELSQTLRVGRNRLAHAV